MEKMKKQINQRMGLTWLGFSILILINAYDSLGAGFPVSDQVNQHIFDFLEGVRMAGTFLLLAINIRYVLALRNEDQLKKLYYQMTDERMAMVRMKSGAPVLLDCSVVLLVASMVAMYIDTTVSVTLIACAVFLILVGVVRKVILNARLTGNEKDVE